MGETGRDADHGHIPYPLLCEALPDATIVVDPLGVIAFANRKACALFGMTRAELTGSKIEQLIPPRLAAGHEALRQRYQAEPVARTMGIDAELFGLRKDGSEFPLEITLGPIKQGADSLVVASIRDLTGNLRFREGAKRAHYGSQLVKLGDLALRSRNIDELLAAIPGFIAETLWADVAVVFWLMRDTGLWPRLMHGIPDALVAEVEIAGARGLACKGPVGDERPRIVNDLDSEARIDAKLAGEMKLASSLRVPLRSKGRFIGLLVTYSKKSFGEEELHFVQAVANSIAGTLMRGEVEAELAHAQRLDSIGQLTGGVAHDFNNILTIVLGNLQMLQVALAQSGGGDYIRLVESAQRACKRGADLTHKLLTFARKQSLSPVAVDLQEALGALAEMLQRTLGEKIRIELDVAPGCPPCLADALQLDNAIVNLALNARDSMPDGGRLRIAVAPFTAGLNSRDAAGELAPGVYVMVSVTDSGQGMPPALLKRAIEPFFTTKPSGKGSGLGLSMVYGFVKQSGGAMDMVSEPGRGTEVRLYFPVADRRSTALKSRRRVGIPGDGVPPKRETILVVDDDLEVLDLAEVILKMSGYGVLRAANTADALHYLQGPEPVSLLFTDVVLGAGETGPRLAAEARKLRARLPVLYTSGFAHGSLSEADSEPAHFLAKPYDRDELIARIETLLKPDRRQSTG